MKKYDDPNTYYLEHDLITPDRAYIPPQQPKNNMNISEWLVGKDSYTLRYAPNESRSAIELKNMSLIDNNGKKTNLSLQEYKKLMDKFAKAQSFEPLHIKKQYLDGDI